MTFIRVRNFEKFQHYRDRKPPWIKLYRDLLENDKFFELTDVQRYHLIGLFILASQNDNLIPNKPDWLKHQLRTKTAISLETLVATGWVDVVEQDASGLLASCYQGASRETETEKRRVETEGETLAFGEFANVVLTREEHGKLIAKLTSDGAAYWIEELSRAIASKGLKYKSHYATILTWERSREAKNGYKNKQDRNAEAARRLLSRLDSQNRSSGDGGITGSQPSSLSRAVTALIGPRNPNSGNANN